jgi:hypothetical protein
MRLDSAGMLVPDPPPEPIDLRYRCPDCGCTSWPGVDRHGHVTARRCITCQIRTDEEDT